MKSKMIVLTAPKAWSFKDEATGLVRSGQSAVCYLPFEGVCQTFSNLPPNATENAVYEVELGFKQVTGTNGKMGTLLTLVNCPDRAVKIVDWAKVIEK